MNPASQSAPSEVAIDIFVGLVFIVAGVIYMIPSIVAFRRTHPNRWIILVINFVFGTTILGWGAALIWSLRAVHRTGAEGSGGESGLNIFVNDVRKVQLIESPPLPQASTSQELERLHSLLTRGVLSQDEFDGLKAKLLGAFPRVQNGQ
jgi:Superinfection immunity protein